VQVAQVVALAQVVHPVMEQAAGRNAVVRWSRVTMQIWKSRGHVVVVAWVFWCLTTQCRYGQTELNTLQATGGLTGGHQTMLLQGKECLHCILIRLPEQVLLLCIWCRLCTAAAAPCAAAPLRSVAATTTATRSGPGTRLALSLISILTQRRCKGTMNPDTCKSRGPPNEQKSLCYRWVLCNCWLGPCCSAHQHKGRHADDQTISLQRNASSRPQAAKVVCALLAAASDHSWEQWSCLTAAMIDAFQQS
jgi:hypothetical protein